MTNAHPASVGMDVGTNVVGSEVGATTPLDFPL